MRDRTICRRDAGSTLERQHKAPLNRYRLESLAYGGKTHAKQMPAGVPLQRSGQTASDCDVKWNCFTFRAGVNEAPRPCVSEPLTRSGAPIISTFPGASSSRMLWLKRKLRTGY